MVTYNGFFSPLVFPPVFALAGIMLFGCNNPSDNKKNNQTINTTATGNAMSMFSASVKSLKLPFTDTCFNTLAIQKKTLPDSLSKFKAYGQLVGKINETGDYIALLYSIPADVQLPVLHTFTTNGEKISTLKLFIGNCCGENEDCSGLSTVVITKDMHIILKDSMQTFERDKKKFDKKKKIKTLKKYEEYKIESTGKIVPIGNPVD